MARDGPSTGARPSSSGRSRRCRRGTACLRCKVSKKKCCFPEGNTSGPCLRCTRLNQRCQPATLRGGASAGVAAMEIIDGALRAERHHYRTRRRSSLEGQEREREAHKGMEEMEGMEEEEEEDEDEDEKEEDEHEGEDEEWLEDPNAPSFLVAQLPRQQGHHQLLLQSSSSSSLSSTCEQQQHQQRHCQGRNHLAPPEFEFPQQQELQLECSDPAVVWQMLVNMVQQYVQQQQQQPLHFPAGGPQQHPSFYNMHPGLMQHLQFQFMQHQQQLQEQQQPAATAWQWHNADANHMPEEQWGPESGPSASSSSQSLAWPVEQQQQQQQQPGAAAPVPGQWALESPTPSSFSSSGVQQRRHHRGAPPPPSPPPSPPPPPPPPPHNGEQAMFNHHLYPQHAYNHYQHAGPPQAPEEGMLRYTHSAAQYAPHMDVGRRADEFMLQEQQQQHLVHSFDHRHHQQQQQQQQQEEEEHHHFVSAGHWQTNSQGELVEDPTQFTSHPHDGGPAMPADLTWPGSWTRFQGENHDDNGGEGADGSASGGSGVGGAPASGGSTRRSFSPSTPP